MRNEIRGMLGLIMMSLRNLRHRKARTLLTIIGITIGVAAMISVSITQETAQRTISDTYNEAAGNADLIVTNPTASIADTVGFDADALDKVRGTSGVELAAPLIQFTTLSSNEKWEDDIFLNRINGTLLYGIDPVSSSAIEHYHLVSGSNLGNDSSYSVLISQSYAELLDVSIGDILQLEVPGGGQEDFQIIGMIDSSGLARLNYEKVVLANLETVAAVSGRLDRLDQIDVVADTDIGPEQVKLNLENSLGDEYSVSTPESKGEQTDDTAQLMASALGFMALLIMAIGVFLIYNTFTTIMAERSREMGLMRAIGAGKSHLIGMVLGEACVLGVLGTVLGIPLGIGLAQGLGTMIERTTDTQMNSPTVLPEHIVFAFVVGIGISLLASLIPAIQSGRLSPLEALVEHSDIRRIKSRRYLFLGIILLVFSLSIFVYHMFASSDISFTVAFAVLLVGLLGIILIMTQMIPPLERILGRIMRFIGIYGEIGGRNLSRRPARTALTAGILMMGIASIILAGGTMEANIEYNGDYVDTIAGSDLAVLSPQPIPQQIVGEIDAMPGVSAATGVGFIPARMISPNSADKVLGVFIGFDPSVYDGSQWGMQWLDFEGSEAEALASLESDSTVFITSYTAVHYGLGVGDSITLETLEGRKPFEIIAVVYGRDLTGFTVQGSWTNALKYYGTNDVNYIKINANPGYDLDAIEADITERWGGAYHLEVEPYEVWFDRLMSGIEETNSVANVMQLIGIIIVALAIINTLMMNIWERRRELGMLRAVGMTRWQLMGIITAEALGLGLLGGLIGTGMAFLALPTVTDGYASLLELGTDIPSVFSASSIAIAIGIAIMMPVAASLLPAWQGTRIDIAEAMRTE